VNMILCQTQLQHLGLEVFTATDGALALQALHAQGFDIVLMDCQMPTMDGYEAVRQWRAIEARRDPGARPRTPVVALSANAMAGDRERSHEAGYDDHLGKPYTREDLGLVLARWLCRRDTKRAAVQLHDGG
jgi:CheY-like chemotaxis protein